MAGTVGGIRVMTSASRSTTGDGPGDVMNHGKEWHGFGRVARIAELAAFIGHG